MGYVFMNPNILDGPFRAALPLPSLIRQGFLVLRATLSSLAPSLLQLVLAFLRFLECHTCHKTPRFLQWRTY